MCTDTIKLCSPRLVRFVPIIYERTYILLVLLLLLTPTLYTETNNRYAIIEIYIVYNINRADLTKLTDVNRQYRITCDDLPFNLVD